MSSNQTHKHHGVRDSIRDTFREVLHPSHPSRMPSPILQAIKTSTPLTTALATKDQYNHLNPDLKTNPQHSGGSRTILTETASVPLPQKHKDTTMDNVSTTSKPDFIHTILVHTVSGNMPLRASFDTGAEENAISAEKARLIGHEIQPCNDLFLTGLNKTVAKPQGLMELSFFFEEHGRKTYREKFVVLNDPQTFDVILSDQFLSQNNLVSVNRAFFPIRRLTQKEKADLVDKRAKNESMRMTNTDERRNHAAEEREKEREKQRAKAEDRVQ